MKKALLFILLFLHSIVNAQNFWSMRASGFSESNRGISSFSIVDATTIWATAYDGSSATPANVRQFTKSLDGGNNWQAFNINLGANQTNLNVSSISAISENVAWITAYSTNNSVVFGGVWKTIDGGVNWTKQTTALFNDVNDSFCNFVHFFDANNGIVQGDPTNESFEIYTTTDGGTNWSRITSNLPAPLTGEYGYGIFETVNSTIWFPTSKGRLYKSTDKGVTWTVHQSPATDFGSNTNFARFSFRDENQGILIKNNLQIYRTLNGGITWTEFQPVGKKGARDIAYIPNTDNVVSVGTENNISFTAYSTDNGNTWTEVMNGTQVVGLKFYNNTTGFGGGFSVNFNTGGIFKLTDPVLAVKKHNSNKRLSIYPNPASRTIKIDMDNFKSIQLYTIEGKEVLHSTINRVNIESVTPGIYTAKITDSSNISTFEKVIITN